MRATGYGLRTSASVLIAIALASAAHAQPAAALGKPLEAQDLAPGTVSVRIIAGSISSPVIGTDVTLVVNEVPRVARTDQTGHAIFKDLPAHARVQAKAVDQDKKEVASETFQLGDSGVKVMLTTKPLAGGAPFMGGGGGAMPEPRAMSGEPRPEAADAPGTYTVRLTYDDFKDAAPVGVPVTLVGYAWDDRVTIETKPTDKDGRAQFTNLDRSGATSYFALAQLPRNGAIDRLFAQASVLDAQTGVRLVLSSDKRTATTPPIDELERIEHQVPATPAGKVRVSVDGEIDPTAPITLIDAETKTVISKGMLGAGPPDPTNISGGAHFEAKPDLPPGTLDVEAHGGAGSANDPLEGVGVRVVPADTSKPPDDIVASKTPASGTLRIAVQPSAKLKAVMTINGRDFQSEPFDLTKSGGTLTIEARWESEGKPEAILDAPLSGPGAHTVYAETVVRGKTYRSLPFQPVEARGTHVSLFVISQRILFSFSWTSRINDEYLLVGGRFKVWNNSWAPYRAGPDGLVVPLPKGFKAAQIDERDQVDVAVATDQGLRLVRPVPPGQRQFHAQFALPVKDGTIDWSLDLPFGALASEMEVQMVDGMDVKLPASVVGEKVDVPQNGKFFVLPQISIKPGLAMAMQIVGLPAAPAWKTWVPRIVGVVVVLMLLGGVALALAGKKAAVDATRVAKRARLLDELVELEKSGTDAERRAAVLAELEQLWD